jgi:hypothetical protein
MPMVALPVEDPTPRQRPTSTEAEEARAYGEQGRRHAIQWLMSEDTADIEVFLEHLVNRPSWYALAACSGLGTDVFFVGRGAGDYDVHGLSAPTAR